MDTPEGRGQLPVNRAALVTNTVLAFLVFGICVATIGPALPWLTQHWHVRLDDGGVLFTMLFTGSCLTVTISGIVLDRIGRKPILVAGLFLMATGFIGLSFSPSLSVALPFTFIIGLGWGCLDVTLNVFVADLFPGTRGTALNLTNTAFGIGSLIAPLAVGTALTITGSPQVVLVSLSGIAMLPCFIFIVLTFPLHRRRRQKVSHPLSSGLTLVREKYLLVATLLFFLYVGIEIGFGGWAYSFATLGAHLGAAEAALVVSVFWIAFTLGRLGAGMVTRKGAGASLVLGGALIAAGGAGAIALFSTSTEVLFIGAALVGIGFAPIFPTAFGLVTDRYPTVSGAVSSVVVLGGSLGGALLPYVQGRLLLAGGVSAAAGFTATVALCIGGLQILLTRSVASNDLFGPS